MDIRIDILAGLGWSILFGIALVWAWSRGYNEGQRIGYSRGRSMSWRIAQSENKK